MAGGALEPLYEEPRQLMDALGKLNGAVALLQEALDPEERAALAPVFEDLRPLFLRELGEHLSREETHLFPAMEKYLSREGGPVGVMLAEHEDLRRYGKDFDEAVRAWRTLLSERGDAPADEQGDIPAERHAVQDVIDAATGLSVLLAEHAHKEDVVLFPMAAHILPPDELDRVGAAL